MFMMTAVVMIVVVVMRVVREMRLLMTSERTLNQKF
jgi:hypothetical protein